MNAVRDVVVLVGSLRKESLNRKMANALRAMAPPSLKLEIVEIGDLPLYNQDLTTRTPPPASAAFKERVAHGRCRAVRHARIQPLGARRAQECHRCRVASVRQERVERQAGRECQRVAGRASVAFGANHHLRQSLVFLNMPSMQQPEAYIGGADKLFDAQGNLTNDSTRAFMDKFLAAFAAWIDRNAARTA